MSTAESNPENPSLEPQRPPPIDKGPLRPAPTQAYDFKDCLPMPSILYVQTVEQLRRVLGRIPQSGPFGFDLEWRPTYTKGAPENPVALIQLANAHWILLCQISNMGGCPTELKEILENPQIVKAGVGIQGDAKKLFRDCQVSMSNCVDLSLLARTVDNARWAGIYNSPIGLARLIECYEYRLLLKGKISRSNWTAQLNSNQQEYAGNDAHAGYTLYTRFETMMPSQSKTVWYSFNVREGNLCNDDDLPWEAKNPDYDPGPLPESKPPTEAQLLRKQRRAEARAAQLAAPSSQANAVPDSGVQPLLEPVSNSQPLTIPAIQNQFPIPQATLPTSNPILSKTPSSFTTKHVGGYHKQTSTRNNAQRFQSTLATGPVSYFSRINSQSTAETFQPQPRPISPSKRRGPPTVEPRKQHGNNRYRHPNRLSSGNTRDSLPSTSHVRPNP